MLGQLHTLKNPSFFLIGALLSMMLAAGCSSSRSFKEETKPEQEESVAKKMPLSEYEATLNPADFDQEVEIIQKVHGEEKLQQSHLDIPKDSVVIQEEQVQGFRVQVFSSSNFDDASLMKSQTLRKFKDDSIYVVYDAPVYKVRVGDFLNRYEANQRLPEFVEKGYRDAWVVPDRIVQRRSVHIPIPK
jgi:hypothetical protein